jgi:hypothetical protein
MPVQEASSLKLLAKKPAAAAPARMGPECRVKEDIEVHLLPLDDHRAPSGSGPHEARFHIIVVGQLIS